MRLKSSFLQSRSEFANSFRILFLSSVLLLLHSNSFGMGLSFGGGTAVSTPTLTVSYFSSLSTDAGEPARIAIDNMGFLYASVPGSGMILRFSPDGSQIGSIRGFLEPLALAVDSTLKRIYVGDVKDGSVKVIDPEGPILFSLGKGNGEFGMPGDIAIASDGTVYVTDSTNDVVKAYYQDGTFKFSFGGSGTDSGQLLFPTGIAIDDSSQEIYVVDHSNGRVEVFDLAGTILRSFSRFGSGDGRLTRPQGLWVSKGRVFVADAFQSNVMVFSGSGTFLGRVGQFGSDAGNLKIPKDVAMSGGKLLVSNAGNRRIEIYSVFDPLGLRVEPPSAAFAKEIAVTPAYHTVSLTSQAAGAAVPWTSSVSAPFSILLSQTMGTAPSAVTVTADASNLSPGTYFGGVVFHANDTDYPVSVSLTVVAPRVSVAPSSLSMFYQVGGDLTTKSLAVTSTGTLSWTAAVNVPWLNVTPTSGSTPGSITVAMNQSIAQLPEGTYSANVTISASGSGGILAVVPVTMKVMRAGTIIVSMNIDASSAVITGAGTYTVSGKTPWRTDEAKPGTYTIQYGPVKGYRKPVSRTFDLRTGQSVVLDGWYRVLSKANVIATAQGPGPNNDARVQLLDLTGVSLASFNAFDAYYGAQVAMGDLDGDGSDEIIVVPGPGPENAARVAVFRSDGTRLTATQPMTGTKYGAHVAVGDINGHGKSVIAMSAVDISRGSSAIVLYGLNDSKMLVEKTRIDGNDVNNHHPASIAFGDVNHDGRFELIVVRSGRIEIYGFDDAYAPTLLADGAIPFETAKSEDYKNQMTVAMGDLDGDDVDEIIIGYEKEQDSFISIVKADLKASGLTIKVFEKRKSAPTLSARDWNDDGMAEILAGQGAHPDNDGIVRIYGPNGDLHREIRAPGVSRYGVVATFGTVKK